MGILDKLFGKKNQPQTPPAPKPAPTPAPTVNQYTEAFHKAISEAAASAPKEEPRISIPYEIDGKQLAYKYEDVQLTTTGIHSSKIKPAEKLTLKENGDKIEAYQGDLLLGTLPQNRLSDMVRDWNKAGDPYLAYIASYSDSGDKAQIYLAFYNNKVERFIAKKDVKQMKLTGKPDDFASPYVGAECETEYDYDKEKYAVTLDGCALGYLPAAGSKYAEAHNVNIEDLKIIVTAVDYDLEKDRDIITVGISE